MASIDGFLDHFGIRPAPHPVPRASLRSLQPRSRKSFEPGNVLLWLLVALLHVGLFVVLDFAMRPSAIADRRFDAPMQVTFIRLVETARPRLMVPADVHHQPHAQSALPLADHALQVISIPQRTFTQTTSAPMSLATQPALVLYDRQGQVRLPAPPFVTRRDPFARRAASDMLPGSDHPFAPGIRLAAVKSPKSVVEDVGAFLFGARPAESCSHYEERVLDADNEADRDEDLARYEHACN